MSVQHRSILWFVSLLFLPGAARAQTPPTEESLIRAWEQVQKSDPATVAFEKKGDRLYGFATKRFPFDGELRILNTVIDDMGMGGTDLVIGIIEAELVGASDDFFKKHSNSYGIWATTNTLHWDKKSIRWMSSRESWRQRMSGVEGSSPWWMDLLSYGSTGLIILLLILVPLLFWRALRASASMKKAMAQNDRIMQMSEANAQRMEKSLEISGRAVGLQEDILRVLTDIRESLKRRD